MGMFLEYEWNIPQLAGKWQIQFYDPKQKPSNQMADFPATFEYRKVYSWRYGDPLPSTVRGFYDVVYGIMETN